MDSVFFAKAFLTDVFRKYMNNDKNNNCQFRYISNDYCFTHVTMDALKSHRVFVIIILFQYSQTTKVTSKT